MATSYEKRKGKKNRGGVRQQTLMRGMVADLSTRSEISNAERPRTKFCVVRLGSAVVVGVLYGCTGTGREDYSRAGQTPVSPVHSTSHTAKSVVSCEYAAGLHIVKPLGGGSPIVLVRGLQEPEKA